MRRLAPSIEARRPRPYRWPSWPPRRVAFLASATAAAGAGLWLWGAEPLAAAEAWAGRASLELSSAIGLRLGPITIVGARRTPARQVRRALGVRRGQAILGIDIRRAKARIEALPWVRSAAVERRLPDALAVRLVEREPVARWRHRGRSALVDLDGTSFAVKDVTDFTRLPLLAGADAPRHAVGLFLLLARDPRLGRRVVSARRVGGRRWNLVFDTGVTVMLPEADPRAAWRRLGALERDHGLMRRGLVAIDLRLPDRVILKTPKGAGGAAKKPGKNT